MRIVSVEGSRTVPLQEFLLGPKRNDLRENELILGVDVKTGTPASRQTFMKVGPRNAMVIAVVSLAVRVDQELPRCLRLGRSGPDARTSATR